MTRPPEHDLAAPLDRPVGNRFDRLEWAGAFGDLGTLIPFMVAYISLLKVDPLGMLFAFGISQIVIGTLFLALPQVPLTLGNAIIAVTEENNRLFPERQVNEKKVSISTGVMNLFGSTIGGVPMCHGAGGMAGHVRFGARTGGAPIILGCVLVLLALFLSGSIETIFKIFPAPVLGVILFLTGGQLALGSCDFGKNKNDRFVSLTVAACSVWNIGFAFVFGMALYHALKRGWVRL